MSVAILEALFVEDSYWYNGDKDDDLSGNIAAFQRNNQRNSGSNYSVDVSDGDDEDKL